MLSRYTPLGSGKPAKPPAGLRRCGSAPLQVTPLLTALLSGNMPAWDMLWLAAPRSPLALAGPYGLGLVGGSAAASPCNTARLSGSMPCGGHATVGSTVQCLCICVSLPELVWSRECCGCSLRTWLWAAGLVPVRGTRTSYVVAGKGNVIHAIGAAEAFCALEAIFRRTDGALCCLIT